MNIEITQEEYQLFQKLLKMTHNELFCEEIKTKPIESLIGKSFSDQDGIFAGQMNGFYYFVSSNKNVKLQHYMSTVENPFILPTKEELSFLYLMKSRFNENCIEDEMWTNNVYWSSTKCENSDINWGLDFGMACAYRLHENCMCLARGVRKLAFN